MRQRLSANFEFWAIINFIIAIFFLLAFITEYNKFHSSEEFMYLFLSIILFITAFFQISADIIEFDNEYLYKGSKRKEMKIPLDKILTVKLTMTRFNNWSLWKIKYYNESNELKTFRFFPNLFEKNFSEFQSLLITKNPNCKIINWSTSFDLDQ